MSIKKLLLSIISGIFFIATSIALAGGPDDVYIPGISTIPPAFDFQPFVYLESNVGYADVNWKDFNASVNPFDVNQHISSGHGGVTGGVATGYQFMRHFAGEFGWQWLPFVHGPDAFNNENIGIESWFLYLAGRLIVPLINNFDLYGLLGVGYRSLDANGPRRDGEYWNVFFAAGLMYHFTQNWLVFGQYMNFPSNHSAPRNLDNAPMANLFNAGIGYDFTL